MKIRVTLTSLAASIILIMIIFSACGGASSPQAVVDQICKYGFSPDFDAQKYMDVVYENNFDTRSKSEEEKEKALSSCKQWLESRNRNASSIYGNDYKCTGSVTDTKTLEGKEYETYLSRIPDVYQTDSIEEIANCNLTLKYDGSWKSEEFTNTLIFVKVKDKWYLSTSLSELSPR